MRTLKKVLALSLVCAMAFTMMAGATFKDQDKINSDLTNDVELMQALNVLKGDENGNLNPTDTVTREQAAKMIYVLKNGGTDDGATGWKGMNLFSDVQSGRWSEGYINYCASIGIINGWMENGKSVFAPTSPVTGVELGKMLLTLVGYKASEQGYTGASWQANVLADGQEAGIFTSFTPSVLAPTPREWTARLMANALNAYSITYSKGELVVSDLTYAQKNLRLYSAEGQLVATNINKLGDDAAATVKDKDDNQIEIKAIADMKNTENATISYDDAKAATPLANLMGEKVKVYFKAGTNTDVANASKIYSVIASKDVVTKEVMVSDITYSSTGGQYISFDGYAKKDYSGKTYVAYSAYDKQSGFTVADFKQNLTMNVKMIDNNNDGYFDVFMMGAPTYYAIVATNDSATSTFTLKDAAGSPATLKDLNGNAITFSKSNATNYTKYLNFVDTVAKDDVVAVTPNNASGKLVYDVKLATKVAEAATGYTLNSDGTFAKIKVGTTNYELAANAMKGYNWNKGAAAGSDKTFYTDGKFVVYSKGADTTIKVDNLAYVIAQMPVSTYDGEQTKVKVLHADGTIAEYVLNTTDGLSSVVNGTVYSYSLTSNNTKIVLKALEDGKDGFVVKTGTDDGGKYASNTGTVALNSVTYKVAADAVFFAKSGTTYKVVKGSELANDQAIGDKQYAVKSVNGFNSVIFGVLGSVKSATSDKMNAFVTGTPSYIGKVGDNYVVTLPVWANGKADTLSFKFTSQADANKAMVETDGNKGQLLAYEYKAIEYTVVDGYVENTALTNSVIDATAAAGSIAESGWYTGALTAFTSTDAVLANQFVKVASDLKVTVVDMKSATSYKVVEGGSVVKSVKPEGEENYNSSVLAKVSVSNGVVTIKEIICEADGEAMNIAR